MAAQSHKVSMNSLRHRLKDTVCVDNFFLDEVCFFHEMIVASRSSSVTVVPDLLTGSSVLTFKTSWTSQFWPRTGIEGDGVFRNDGDVS